MDAERETEQRIPVMAWRARPDMSCEWLSPQWPAFTGSGAEQALGDGWSRGVHPEDLPRWLERCLRAFDEHQPFEIEYRLRRWDGEYRRVLDRAVPKYSRDGAFLGYVGCCIDIEDFRNSNQRRSR